MRSYEFSSDPSRFDLDAIHDFLSQSYWSRGIPKETVARAIANSLCFGVFEQGCQIGFARVITDKASFAYLADVYLLEDHRGQGLARRLLEHVFQHPELQGLRRMLLATRDAHGLYAKLGFAPLAAPDRFMEVLRANPYGAP